MGTFEIQRARPELGFTPATSVKANINVPNLDTGGAIGQAVVAGAGMVQAIMEKRRDMQDDISTVEANRIRTNTDLRIQAIKQNNPQAEWAPLIEAETQREAQETSGLKFSKERGAFQAAKSRAYGEATRAQGLIDATAQMQTDTIKVQTDEIVKAAASGIGLDDAISAFRNGKAAGGMNPKIKELVVAAAKKKGTIQGIQNQGVLDLEGTIASLEGELELRRQGKGEISEDVLSNDDISKLKRSVKATATSASLANERAYKKVAADKETDWLDKYNKGILTEDEIAIADFGVTDAESVSKSIDLKKEWMSKVDTQEKTDYDIGLLTRLQTRVRENPQGITTTEINSFVKKGAERITGTQAAGLIKDLEDKLTGTGGIVSDLKSTQKQTLEKMWQNDLITSTNDYQVMNNAITQYYADNPEATRPQAEEFFKTLTNASVRNTFANRLQRFKGAFGAALKGPFGFVTDVFINEDFELGLDLGFGVDNTDALSSKQIQRNIDRVNELRTLNPATIPSNPQPDKYPDAVWSSQHQVWTIRINGKLKGIR